MASVRRQPVDFATTSARRRHSDPKDQSYWNGRLHRFASCYSKQVSPGNAFRPERSHGQRNPNGYISQCHRWAQPGSTRLLEPGPGTSIRQASRIPNGAASTIRWRSIVQHVQPRFRSNERSRRSLQPPSCSSIRPVRFRGRWIWIRCSLPWRRDGSEEQAG